MAISFGESLDLDVVGGETAPRATGAVVVAQDVNLIMGEAAPSPEVEAAAAAVGSAHEARRLGSLVIGPAREGEPLLFQAVVYDFQRSPPVREVEVFDALVAAFEEARSRQISRMAVRPIGTAHSGLDPATFLRLLAQTCYSATELGTSLRRVHLLLGTADELRRYEALLPAVVVLRNRQARRAEDV